MSALDTKNAAAGFTIIETVLFLAITGVLIVGVIIGVGASVNTQRYRDATESFKNTLQEQILSLSSVRNSRDNSWACTSAAEVVAAQGAVQPQGRGQSTCMVVGRHVGIRGSEITVHTVLAYKTSDTPRATDIETMRQNYTFNVSTLDVDKKNMEWGTQIGWPKAGTAGARPDGRQTPRAISILFLKSPQTGTIYTFSDSPVDQEAAIAVTPTALKALLVAGPGIPGQGQRAICVFSDGLSPTGNRAVMIMPYASNAAAIEMRTDDLFAAAGETTRC